MVVYRIRSASKSKVVKYLEKNYGDVSTIAFPDIVNPELSNEKKLFTIQIMNTDNTLMNYETDTSIMQ